MADVAHCRHGLNPTAGSAEPFLDKGPVGVFCQTAIADLGKAPQALQGQEGMLDLGTHTGLASVGFLVDVGERAVPISSFGSIRED